LVKIRLNFHDDILISLIKELPNLLDDREPDIFLRDDPNDESAVKLNRKKVTNGLSSTKIPLLEDVFKLLPNVPINLDIKINNDLLINKVVNILNYFDKTSIHFLIN
jgi:hypothetical protein